MGGSPGRVMSVSTVNGGVQGEGADRVGEAPVGEHRRVDAAHQVTQVVKGTGGRLARLGNQGERRLGAGAHELLGGAQRHADGDEAGLRAVVQVTLDAAQLGDRDLGRVAAGPVSRSTRCVRACARRASSAFAAHGEQPGRSTQPAAISATPSTLISHRAA